MTSRELIIALLQYPMDSEIQLMCPHNTIYASFDVDSVTYSDTAQRVHLNFTDFRDEKPRVMEYAKTDEPEFPNIEGCPAEIFYDGEWKRGKIVKGYRFGDGIVTIETEDGTQLWCGQSRTDLYRRVEE